MCHDDVSRYRDVAGDVVNLDHDEIALRCDWPVRLLVNCCQLRKLIREYLISI